MSLAYDEYLNAHIEAVQKGWNWMIDNLIDRIHPWICEQYPNSEFDPIDILEIGEQMQDHDASKTRPEEYYAYDAYFYGGNKSHAVVENFRKAFLSHIHENPHHWRDWWTFSWRKGDLMEIFNWWDEHKNYIRMHKKSRKVVSYILKEMKDILMEGKAEEKPEEPISHADISDEEKEDKKKFGLPDLKKYPMPDPDHVKSAIRFFNYVDPKHEKELAEAILERMKEYRMSFEDFGVGDENRFKNYIPKADRKDPKDQESK